jgi:small subunit ribosomal protein S14
MHCYTRPTQIKNRCIAGGKGKGVFRDFRMARVGSTLENEVERENPRLTSFLQYQFRMHALAGQLPGVKKASW